MQNIYGNTLQHCRWSQSKSHQKLPLMWSNAALVLIQCWSWWNRWLQWGRSNVRKHKNRPVMRNELKWNQMRWSIKNQWNFSIFSFRTRKKVVSENLSEFGEQLIARKRETTFSMQSYEKRSSEFPSRHSASDLTKRGIIDESFFSLVRVRARKCASVYVRANDSARERLRASRHARAAMCHLCASGVVRPGSRYFA